MLGLDATAIIIGVGCAILGAILGVVFGFVKEWLWERFHPHRGVRIDVVEERGPTSQEYGFTEKVVKLTIRNESGGTVHIQDIRLMFSPLYGLPVLSEAPPPRSHPALPATVASGTMMSWYFGAEKLSLFLKSLFSETSTTETEVKLRPRILTTTGKTYRGSAFRLSLDVNAHWP